MPPTIFNPLLRSSRHYTQPASPITWRLSPHHQHNKIRETSSFSSSSSYSSYSHSSPAGDPSRLSRSLATGFWRICIVISLLPPAYFAYLLKQRFWPSPQTSSSSSSSASLPLLIYAEERLGSATQGQRGMIFRMVGGGGSRNDEQRSVHGLESELGNATSIGGGRERDVKLKRALEMVDDDVGLLRELEQRRQEREVERARQRRRLVMIAHGKGKEEHEEARSGKG